MARKKSPERRRKVAGNTKVSRFYERNAANANVGMPWSIYDPEVGKSYYMDHANNVRYYVENGEEPPAAFLAARAADRAAAAARSPKPGTLGALLQQQRITHKEEA